MEIRPLRLHGAYEILLAPGHDERGYFMRVYDKAIFHEHGLQTSWIQENQSLSIKKYTIRGLHFQWPPHAETKLVRVISGEVYDIVLDLRKGSATFGDWDSIKLSADNKNMLYIPRGFAHGMCTLTDNCVMLYKVDNYYAPESEGAIRWDDPDIGIDWPVDNPILSEKDSRAESLKAFVKKYGGLEVE